MAHKRKFSESFHTDTDMVENLLKYRKTCRPASIKKTTVRCVSQDDLRSVLDNFARIYEGLDTQHSSRKPNFTYTELIFLAVMRSPNFCLPITEIYRYIQTRFSYFKETSKKHWKNAIRHSLAKTKCFTKIGLKNQKPRNGILNRSSFLWTIIPNSLLTFVRGDYRPTNKFSGSNALRSAFQQVNGNGLWEGCVLSLTHRMEAFQNILDSSPSPAELFQLQMCNLEDHSQVGSDFGHRMSEVETPLSPQNVSLVSPYDDVSVWTGESASPSHDTGSDASGCNSDSSGYDTFEELSSPEFSEYNERPTRLTPPCQDKSWSTNRGASDTSISLPEVTPECIYNVPTLPDIPPLRLTFDNVAEVCDLRSSDGPSYVMTPCMIAGPALNNMLYANNLHCYPNGSCTLTEDCKTPYYFYI